LFSLHHVLDLDWMLEAYRLTRKDGAPGIDGVTATAYEANLEANLRDLLDRMLSGRYQAPPVRRAYIPKGDGSQRPLGIPTFEDKVAQRAVAMVLEAIYEQDFHDCSYGFRPGRSAHQALRHLRSDLRPAAGLRWVIDLDIQSYFETISHTELRRFLDQRVTDGVIRRLIDKWLKAGVLEAGALHRPTAGTPQGGVISPVLSNLFLHHVLDDWFEQTVRPRLSGSATLVRYADDAVLAFATYRDAMRVHSVLPKRLARFGLTLNTNKTQLVDFRFKRPAGSIPPAVAGTTFSFLGFTHVWGRSRNGKPLVKQVTDKHRYARGLLAVKAWCRENRHRPLHEQHAHLSAVLRGHYAYYGVPGNSRRLRWFQRQVVRTWQKWLARRGARRGFPWARFNAYLAANPLPPPRLAYHYAAGSEPPS
jgi:group II intron reverse transcriptase/maturase